MQYIPMDNIHLLSGRRLDLVSYSPDAAGLVLEIRESAWTSEDWLILDLTTEQESLVRVTFSFFQDVNAAPDTDPDYRVAQKLIPGIRLKAGFPLRVLASSSSFLAPLPGQYKSTANGLPTRVEKMHKVIIRFSPDLNLKKVVFHQVGLFRTKPDVTVMGKLLVDEMGQIDQKSWPGKMPGIRELVTYLKRERQAALLNNQYPESFSQFGGWLAKRFKPTGWFGVHHDGRRWWLTDPDGYAFLSNGVC